MLLSLHTGGCQPPVNYKVEHQCWHQQLLCYIVCTVYNCLQPERPTRDKASDARTSNTHKGFRLDEASGKLSIPYRRLSLIQPELEPSSAKIRDGRPLLSYLADPLLLGYQAHAVAVLPGFWV